MRRLLSGTGRRLLKVPERDPRQAVASLLLGCLIIAPSVLFYRQDADHLAHFVLGLHAFVDAVLYLMPDDLHREKVALRITGLTFVLAVALPLSIYYASRISWVTVLLPVLLLGPVLALVIYLNHLERRQGPRHS